MFIRLSNDYRLSDRVRLIADLAIPIGKFTVGHEFKITVCRDGTYDLMDDEGYRVTHCKPEAFEHITKFDFSTVPSRMQIVHDRLTLWAHLVSEHAGIFSLDTPFEGLVQAHEDEHNGPGTIRNHPRESRKASLAKIAKVLSEVDSEWGDQS